MSAHSSAVAYGAISEPRRVDVVRLQQTRAQGSLVDGLPVKIEHPIGGSQVLLRVTMAIEAPLHGQRRRARGQGHGVDRPVAAFAPDAFCNVDAVVEV